MEKRYESKPIALDEDWLLRNGFAWKNNGLRNKNMCIRELNGCFYVYLSNEGKNFEVKLEYVHQIQNIHFDLFKEELIQ